MASILVAHSYFLRFDQKQLERAKPYPPLATLQVAAELRAAGHDVTVFDAMLADGPGSYARVVARATPTIALFYEDNFNYLSKMCLGRMRSACNEMIAAARARGAFVILAGSDATDAPDVYFTAGANVVLLGEGLDALRTLAARLHAHGDGDLTTLVSDLPGIVYVDELGATQVSKVRALPEHSGPMLPAWDLIDVERYRSTWLRAHGYFSLNMAASRGCSFRCNWCAKPIWGNRYLQRAPQEVAQEMAYLKRTLHPDHIWFADDIFGFRVDWIDAFADALDARDGALPFTIQTRADLVSDAAAGALRRAHCKEVWLGAESGSQRVLDAMNKGTTVAQVLAARDHLGRHGLRVGFFIQLGYLGETLEDLIATRALIEAARPDDIGVSVSYPLPGTKFHELVKEQLQRKTHWDESNDLAMMFAGTYRTDFYRAFRNLLHEQVDLDCARTSDESRRSLLREKWLRLLAAEDSYRNHEHDFHDAPNWSHAAVPSQ
jgi:anaerobic magnesium-protoporphyrin IX monomethyl ester cyclase